MSNGLKATLTLSIVLNVLLAGMLLGDVMRSCVAPAPVPFDITAQLGQLPADQRQLFESVLSPAKKEMDATRAKIDAAKKEAIRLLKTTPFDENAYMKQIHHIEELHSQIKLHTADSLAKLAVQLQTQQERDVLVEIVSHPPFTMPQPPVERPAEEKP